MSSLRSRTSVEIHGISFTDIKEMVESIYGSCMWSIDDNGDRTCYPTLDSSVTVSFDPDTDHDGQTALQQHGNADAST